MNTLPEPVDSGLPGRTRAARGALSRNAKVRKISFTRSLSARFLHHFFVGSFSKPSHCKIFIVIQCPSDNDPNDYLLLPHRTFLMTALRSHSPSPALVYFTCTRSIIHPCTTIHSHLLQGRNLFYRQLQSSSVRFLFVHFADPIGKIPFTSWLFTKTKTPLQFLLASVATP